MEERERESAKADNKDSKDPPAAASSVEQPVQDIDEEIDVCSDKFNPLRALYAPSVPLPFPNVKCFNNVSEYESFLRGGRGRAKPENVEKKRRKAMKGVADPERIERLKKLMVNNPVPEAGEAGESSGSTPRRRKQRPQKNVLTRMPLCAGSPLGELYRCVEERIRVKVHIRTFKGLRGVCSGFVVAFDKFWNMAMVDVDETYREPLLGEALYHEKALTISRLFEKLKLQESSACDEPSKKLDIQETASKPQPPAHQKSKKEDRGTGSKLSDINKTKKDTAPLKEQGLQVCKKKDSQTYGKVHTRHVNQLFIRGENVILVNPQPL